MKKIQRTFGVAVLAAVSLAVATTGTAGAQAPKLSVSVSEGSVTLSGVCPKESSVAHGWYGFVDGVEPESIQQMTYDKGAWTTTFTNVKPGTYVAVLGCESEEQTATQRFIVEG